MKNELFFTEMKNQLKFGLKGKVVAEFQKDLDEFYEINKDLPEDEFKKSFIDKFSYIFEVYNKYENYNLLLNIHKKINFFYVLTIIMLVASILAFLIISSNR